MQFLPVNLLMWNDHWLFPACSIVAILWLWVTLQCSVSLFESHDLCVPQDSCSLCVSAGVCAAQHDDSSRPAGVCSLGRGVSVPGLHRCCVRTVQRSVSVRCLAGRHGLHVRRCDRIRLRPAASGVSRIRGGRIRSISTAAAADGPHAMRNPPFTLWLYQPKKPMYVFYCSVIVIIAILFVGLVFNIYYGKESCSLSNMVMCSTLRFLYATNIFFIIHSPSCH